MISGSPFSKPLNPSKRVSTWKTGYLSIALLIVSKCLALEFKKGVWSYWFSMTLKGITWLFFISKDSSIGIRFLKVFKLYKDIKGF